MHQLTVAAETGATTTTHHDYDDASRALLTHAKRSDTYLRPLVSPTHAAPVQRACFELISLDARRGRPNIAATAFIEPLVVTASGTAVTPYYTAAAALHWISDDHHAGAAASDERRRSHPALDAAAAVIQSPLMAEALWCEAAALAELPEVPALPASVLCDLRHMFVSRGYRPASAAALAAAVQRQLDTAVPPEQLAVATWWAALVAASAAAS
ncbi:hypothetical protein ABFW14_32930 [Mycolicibacterium fortuitum]|uniref:Uncharacterized protein n=1 Tax=Mycolicibacterium septicum DSM 44393 TaxID=1341646 RepID=A0A7X6MVG1_9MYCO|nr:MULTISPECIES: hypothetical protein [Mycolicibacterium]MBX8687869.1 hypothetical protein [Mycobacterium sp. 20091114027_K0903767]OCB48684.1 hypothetical protein A5721_04885 [Mycolicibacterium vulneris]NKZ15034.1 hypothetical protein [Mycolicibacterium septicum DSM 44393]OBK01653.1 hypothetical protein A5637_18815 [Mycolicibacterium fortuitum]OBK61266.1 hypothetical protein A5654_28595 [Mycolicibacterium fortuitum]